MRQWRLIGLIIFLVVISVVPVSAADLKFVCNDENCQLTPQNTPFFAQTNVLPGSIYTSFLTVKNNSKLMGEFSLRVVKAKTVSTEPDLGQVMTLAVRLADSGHQTVVSALPINSLNQLREPLDLGRIEPGQSQTYELVVTFDRQAGNEYQGRNLNFSLALTGQLDVGQTTPPPFITPIVKPSVPPTGQVLGVSRADWTQQWQWWLAIWLMLILFLIFYFKRRRKQQKK